MMTDKATLPQSTTDTQSRQVERRRKARLTCSYPATIHGRMLQGMWFEAHAILLNMSASGMYLLTNRRLVVGEFVQLVVRLSTAPTDQGNAPQIMASGNVVRSRNLPDGTYGIAVSLQNHRFL